MKKERIPVIAALAALLVVLGALGVWMSGRTEPKGNQGQDQVKAQFAVTQVDPKSAPADVQDAIAKLYTSRVGYAIRHPDQTYLVISTGGDDLRIALAKPDAEDGSLVNVSLTAKPGGARLLVLSAPAGSQNYQFELDGDFAAIPTLYNPDNLPLIALDAAKRYALVTPQPEMVVEGDTLHVAGYARVFEAQFSVTLVTAKGRKLATAAVHAASGAPSWASFTADMKFDAAGLPDTGMLIFDDGFGAKLVVPIRFHSAPQLG